VVSEELELPIHHTWYHIDFADLVGLGKDAFLRYLFYKSVDQDFEQGYLSSRAVVLRGQTDLQG
jgi:hypothetical protein